MKRILVLGGGFAGVAAIKELLKEPDTQVILVSNEPYHVFHASLYEVATSEMPKKSIAIPYADMFGRRITFFNKQVRLIKPKAQQVTLDDGTQLYYDYLLIALGSIAACFHVPGLKQYGYPLKTLHDAIQIKQMLTHLFTTHTDNTPIRILIGGGGFAGVELGMELAHFATQLSEKHSHPFTIQIIQGSERLLKELPSEVSDLAAKRARQFHVEVYTNEHIQEVSKDHLKTDAGKLYPYHLFIWTGGVEANPLGEKSGFIVNKKKQISIDQTLSVPTFPTIFAAGDIAGTPEPVPWTATIAIEQGKLAARNIIRTIRNQPREEYVSHSCRYIVPMHGKFAVAVYSSFLLVGVQAWVLQQLVFLYYLVSILPLRTAFKRWTIDEKSLLTH